MATDGKSLANEIFHKDGAPGMEGDDSDGEDTQTAKLDAASMLISAVHSKDPKAVSEALDVCYSTHKGSEPPMAEEPDGDEPPMPKSGHGVMLLLGKPEGK